MISAALARFGIPLGGRLWTDSSTFLYSSVDMLTTECKLMTGPTHPLWTLVVRLRLVLGVLTPSSLHVGLAMWWTVEGLSRGLRCAVGAAGA